MKFIKHLLVFFFIKLPVQLIGIPILAVLLLFIPKDVEYLPRLFRWWDNHERYTSGNKSDDGLSGPDYIRDKWRNPTGWLARFNWLALRNPANYFQYFVLGAEKHSHYEKLKQVGAYFNDVGELKYDPISSCMMVGTHTWNTRGWYYQEVLNGDDKLWEFYMVWPLYKKWHFRLRAGWKLGGFYSNKNTGDGIQWVLAVTPFKKLE